MDLQDKIWGSRQPESSQRKEKGTLEGFSIKEKLLLACFHLCLSCTLLFSQRPYGLWLVLWEVSPKVNRKPQEHENLCNGRGRSITWNYVDYLHWLCLRWNSLPQISSRLLLFKPLTNHHHLNEVQSLLLFFLFFSACYILNCISHLPT